MKANRMKKPSVKLTWFKMYPADWLISEHIAVMEPLIEVHFFRALLLCYRDGSIPADSETLAKLIGKGCSQEHVEKIRTFFIADPTDTERLTHKRVLEQAKERKQQSKKKRKAAKKRWKKKGNAHAPAKRLHDNCSTGEVQPHSKQSRAEQSKAESEHIKEEESFPSMRHTTTPPNLGGYPKGRFDTSTPDDAPFFTEGRQ